MNEVTKRLLPPELEETKFLRLAELAERLDGCNNDFEDCNALEIEFNNLANTNLKLSAGDFHFSGATNAGTFVRGILTPKPQKIADVTYEEMLNLVTRICDADGTEHELNYWLHFLEAQTDNYNLSDLIYHPDQYFDDNIEREQMTPKEILDAAMTKKPRVIELPLSTKT